MTHYIVYNGTAYSAEHNELVAVEWYYPSGSSSGEPCHWVGYFEGRWMEVRLCNG